MADNELVAAFLAAAPSETFEDTPELRHELSARIDAARTAWPSLPLADVVFARHLAMHTSTGLAPEKAAPDLWLACACATGVVGAATEFEKAHKATIERAVARVSRSSVDEVTQAVLVALLVSEPGARPRIAEYGGRSALRTWLTTVATNAALNRVQRKENQEVRVRVGAIRRSRRRSRSRSWRWPKARHGPEASTRRCVRTIATLDKRHRVLLRLHYVQGWTMDRLATMYRTSRSSAGRRVVEARPARVVSTKQRIRLRKRLQLTPTELDSLLVVLQSGLSGESPSRMLDADE